MCAPQDRRRLSSAASRPKLNISLRSQAAQLFRTIESALSRVVSTVSALHPSEAADDLAHAPLDPQDSSNEAEAHAEFLLTADCIHDTDRALEGLMHRHGVIRRASQAAGIEGLDPRLAPNPPAGRATASSSSAPAGGPSTRRRQRQNDSVRLPFARQLQLLADSSERCRALLLRHTPDPELRLMVALHCALKAHHPRVAQQQLQLGESTAHICPSTPPSILHQLQRVLDASLMLALQLGRSREASSEWLDVDVGLNPAALATPENPQKYIEAVACDNRYPAVLRSLALAAARLLAASASIVGACAQARQQHTAPLYNMDDNVMSSAVLEFYTAMHCYVDAAVSLDLAADCCPMQQVLEHVSLVPSLMPQLMASFLKSNDAGVDLGEAFGGFFESSCLPRSSTAGTAKHMQSALSECALVGFPSILCLACVRQLVLLRRSALYSGRHPGHVLQHGASACSTAVQLMHVSLAFVRGVGIISIAGFRSDLEAAAESKGLPRGAAGEGCGSSVESDGRDSDVDTDMDSPPTKAPSAVKVGHGKTTPILSSMSPSLTPMLVASASQASAHATTKGASTASMPLTVTAVTRLAYEDLSAESEGALPPAIDLGAAAIPTGTQRQKEAHVADCDFSDVEGFLRTLLCTLQLLLDDMDQAAGWTLQHDTFSTDKTAAVLATLHAQLSDSRLAPAGIAATNDKSLFVPEELKFDASRLNRLVSGLSGSAGSGGVAAASRSQGTPLMASMKAEHAVLSLKGDDSDTDLDDSIAYPRRAGSVGVVDRSTAGDLLTAWQMVFQRACAKTRLTPLEALRVTSKDGLKAWSQVCMVLYSTPLAVHGLVLKAASVLQSVLAVPSASARVVISPEAPCVLQQSLLILDECASSHISSQVLVSELPLSCHLDQPARAGDLPGALWTGVKAEDATIIEMLHTCMIWERQHGDAAPALGCCAELFSAIEQRLVRPWLRLPEAPAALVQSIKNADSDDADAANVATALDALSLFEHKVDMTSMQSAGELLSTAWAKSVPSGLELPTTQSRVEADTLLWDGARSGESITIAANGSIATQRMPRSWGTAIGAKGFAPGTGVHKFDIQIKRCTSANIFIGVSTREASSSTFVGGDHHSWGMSSQSQVWHNRTRQGYGGGFGRRFYPGTIVRVTVNTVTGDVSFGTPTRPWGVVIHSAGHDSNGRMLELFPAVSLYSRGDEVRLRAVQDSAHAASDRSEMARVLLRLNQAKSNLHRFESQDDLDVYEGPGWRRTVDARSRRRSAAAAQARRGGLHMSWLPPVLSVHLAGEAAADTLCADEYSAVSGIKGSHLLLKIIKLRCGELQKHLRDGQDLPSQRAQAQAAELAFVLSSIEHQIVHICDPAWVLALCSMLERLRACTAVNCDALASARQPAASDLHYAHHSMSAVWQVVSEDKGGQAPHEFCVSLHQGAAGDFVGAASSTVSTLLSNAHDLYSVRTGIVHGRVSGDIFEMTISWVNSTVQGGDRYGDGSAKPLVFYFRGCIAADGSAVWLLKRDSKDDAKTARSFMTFLCPNHSSAPRDALGVLMENQGRARPMSDLKRGCISILAAASSNELNYYITLEQHISKPFLCSLLLAQQPAAAEGTASRPDTQGEYESCSFDELTRYGLSSLGELFSDVATLSSVQSLAVEVLHVPASACGALLQPVQVAPLPNVREYLSRANDAALSSTVIEILRGISASLVAASGDDTTIGAAQPRRSSSETKEEEDEANGEEDATETQEEHNGLQDTCSIASHVCMHFCRSPAAGAGLVPELTAIAVTGTLGPYRPVSAASHATDMLATNSNCGIEPICAFFCGASQADDAVSSLWTVMHNRLLSHAMKGFANRITRRYLDSACMRKCVESFVGVLLHHEGLGSIAAAASADAAVLQLVEDEILAPLWRQAMVCALEIRKLSVKSSGSEIGATATNAALRLAAANCQALLLFSSATLCREHISGSGTVDISGIFQQFCREIVSGAAQASCSVPVPVRHFWAADVVPSIFAFCACKEPSARFQLLSTAFLETLKQYLRFLAMQRLQRILLEPSSAKDWHHGIPNWLEPTLYYAGSWTAGHAMVSTDGIAANAALGSCAGSIFLGSPAHAALHAEMQLFRHTLVGIMRHLTLPSVVTSDATSPAMTARRFFAWPDAWDCVLFVLAALSTQSESAVLPSLAIQSWEDSTQVLEESQGGDSFDLQMRAIIAALAWAQGTQASSAQNISSARDWCGFMGELWEDTLYKDLAGPFHAPIDTLRTRFASTLSAASAETGLAKPDESLVFTLQGHSEELIRIVAIRVLTDQYEQILTDLTQVQHVMLHDTAACPPMAMKVPGTELVSLQVVTVRTIQALKPLVLLCAALFKELTKCSQVFRTLDFKDSYSDAVEKPDEIRDAWTEYKRVGLVAGGFLPRRNASGLHIVSDLKRAAVQHTLQSLTACTAEWSLYRVLTSLHQGISLQGVRCSLATPAWCTVLWGCAHCWVAPPRLRQRAMRLLRLAALGASPAAMDRGFQFACGTADPLKRALQLDAGAQLEAKHSSGASATEAPPLPSHAPEAEFAGSTAVKALLDSARLLHRLPIVAPRADALGSLPRASKAARRAPAPRRGKKGANTPSAGTESEAGVKSTAETSSNADAWSTFLSTMTADFQPVFEGLTSSPEYESGLTSQQLAAAQASTVAEVIMLLRQLAGLAQWRSALLHVFSRALDDLAAVEGVQSGSGSGAVKAAVPAAHQSSPLEQLSQLASDERSSIQAGRGLAVLAVMGGFRDLLRPGVLAKQVTCSVWDLPGEDKLPSTTLNGKHGHVLFGEEPIWGSSAEGAGASDTEAARWQSVQSYLASALRSFGVESRDHVAPKLRTVAVGAGCRLSSNSTNAQAALQACIINATRDAFPYRSHLFQGMDACASDGKRKASTSLPDSLGTRILQEALNTHSGRQQAHFDNSRLDEASAVFEQLCRALRGQPTRLSMWGRHTTSSWQPLLCCVGAVVLRCDTPDASMFGRVVCKPNSSLCLPQLQTPDVLGNFTYAGASGVDLQVDLPPPQLGLGTIVSVDANSDDGSAFRRPGSKCLVAARSGGPNSYLVSLPSRLLAAENEIAPQPCDFPTDMLKVLTIGFLPALLRQYLAGAGASPSEGSSRRGGTKRRLPRAAAGGAPSQDAHQVSGAKTTSGIDVQMLQSTLRVNVLRALSCLLTHSSHSDQLQQDLSAQFTEDRAKKPDNLVGMLLALARLPDQNITAHSLHLAEQGHSMVGVLLTAKQRQQAQTRVDGIIELTQGAGIDQPARSAPKLTAGAPASAAVSPSGSAGGPHSSSLRLLSALGTELLPPSIQAQGMLSSILQSSCLCPLQLPHLTVQWVPVAAPVQTPKPEQSESKQAARRNAPSPQGGDYPVAEGHMSNDSDEMGENHSSGEDEDGDDQLAAGDELSEEEDEDGEEEDEDGEGIIVGEEEDFYEGGFGGGDGSEDSDGDGDGDEEVGSAGLSPGLFGSSSMFHMDAERFMNAVRGMSSASESAANRLSASSALRAGLADRERSLARMDAASGAGSSASTGGEASAGAAASSSSRAVSGAAEAIDGSGGEAGSGAPSPHCSMMMDMGFKREWCELALRRSGNVEMACNFIFENMAMMDTLVEAVQQRQGQSGGAAQSSPASSVLVAEVAAALGELGFPENWAERCVQRSKAPLLQEALSWAVANFESLQREDTVSAVARAEADGDGEQQDSKPTVKLHYIPGARPAATLSNQTAEGLPPRLCTVLSGKASISGSLQISASHSEAAYESTFPSIRFSPLRVSSGKWYYEVIVQGNGLLQVGWCDDLFTGNAFAGLGVGDDMHSWAWDGRRTKLWHDGSIEWGKSWTDGDVVCCCIDLDNGRMYWGLNGSYAAPMGLGFAGFRSQGALYPALTVQSGSKCQLRVGESNRQFLCGPPPGYLPVLQAAANNQCLPREESHAARRCMCPQDHSPDQLMCSSQRLDRNVETVAAEGGAMYSSTGAWRKRHFTSGRIGHTSKVLSGAVGVGGGMRRSKNSPISADSGPVRTAAIKVAPGISFSGSSGEELCALAKLSMADLRMAHLNLSASLSVLYARKILATMLALFKPADRSEPQPLLSLLDMVERSPAHEAPRQFVALLMWLSWTGVSMLPVEIAQLVEAAARAPSYRLARQQLDTKLEGGSWNFLLENPVNAHGVSAAVQHVVTASSHNFAGAAGTELARLPNGVNLCAAVEPALLMILQQRTFHIYSGLYSQRSLSPTLKALLKQLKSSLVNTPADSTQWPGLKAPGSSFDPPATTGAWTSNCMFMKHNLGGIQWFFALLMAMVVHQRCCMPPTDGTRLLGTALSGRKKSIQGAMGASDVQQKDEDALLRFSRALSEYAQHAGNAISFVAFPLTLELFSALCAGAQSGNDTFKAVVFGMLAGLCDELLRDLLACEAALMLCPPPPTSTHVGACLLDVLQAHVGLWTAESLDLWLSVRLEGERTAGIGSIVAGAAVELHTALFSLKSNMQRLRPQWCGDERDLHIAAALASSFDAPASSPAAGHSETKEEEDDTALEADAAEERGLEKADRLTSDADAQDVLQETVLRAELDDGLPGRTQHAAFLPPAADSASGLPDTPWRDVACGLGTAHGQDSLGDFAPGFVGRNAQSGELELSTGVGQWSGVLISHAPSAQPFLQWGQEVPVHIGLQPNMAVQVVDTPAGLSPPGALGSIHSISSSDAEEGLIVEFCWELAENTVFERRSLEADISQLARSLTVLSPPLPRAFAIPGQHLLDPVWAARHRLQNPLAPLSLHSSGGPTELGTQGVTVRLSIVPHESTAPRSVANSICVRHFDQSAETGTVRRVKGVRVAGTLQLPEHSGAVIGVHGYWVFVTLAEETSDPRKVARTSSAGSAAEAQAEEEMEPDADLSRGAGEGAWRIELEEVALLSGFPEKGWHTRFGHDWYAAGTRWHSGVVPEPVLTKQQPQSSGSPSLVSVQWPDNVVFACDSHFSANGKGSFSSCLLNLQSQFLFKWDPASMGRGIESNAVHTSVGGAPGLSSRSLALGSIGFSSGVHYWEVQIVQSLEPGSILIGVAEKSPSASQNLESALSTWSNHCWGITTNRLLVHPGMQQPFGETLNPGDVVGVRLDADQGKLSFFLDGMQFGEHMIRDMGQAFQSLRSPNCASNAPRVLYPCIGIKHYMDRVRLLPAHISRPRVSHGLGLKASAAGPQAAVGASPLLGAASHMTCMEETRAQRSGPVSVGSRVLDVECFSALLQNWEHLAVLDRVLLEMNTNEASCLNNSGAAARVKRRRSDPDGNFSTPSNERGEAVDTPADAIVQALVRFVVSSWSRSSALQAAPQRMYPSRAGVVVNINRSQAALTQFLGDHGHDLALEVDDILQLNFSYERELQVPEKVQLLGTAQGHLWYRLVSPPQGSDGAAQGFKLAWCLPHSILQLLHDKPLGEYVERPVKQPSHSDMADHRESLSAPSKLAACLAWPQETDPTVRARVDKWLIAVMNTLCSQQDTYPEQITPSQLAIALENAPSAPSALLQAGQFQTKLATGRALVLIELSLLAERVLPWLHLGQQHEPGARSAAADIAAAVSTSSSYASLREHLSRSVPGSQAAALRITAWRPSTLSGRVRHLRALLLKRTKLRLWNATLHTTTHPTTPSLEAFEDPREIQTLRISRGPKTKPERLAKIGKSETRLRTSITGQLMEAVSNLSDTALRRSYVGKGHGGQPRAFLVKLLGEGADDYGGPYRALFESVADELQADSVKVAGGSVSLLPVLTPCVNRFAMTLGSGSQQLPSVDGFQPSEEQLASSVYGREALAFVGRLAGMAMRHGINMPIALVPHVLKQLVRSPLQRSDAELANGTVALSSLLPVGFDSVPARTDPDARAKFNLALKEAGQTFAVEVAPGVQRELVHRGALVSVTADSFIDFVELAQAATLAYARDQVASLAQGLSAVVPYDMLPIWTPCELNELLGGDEDVSVASLKAMTEYGDSLSSDEQHVQWLWEVLGEGQPSDRIAFLRFVAARSRLPSSLEFLPTGLTISSSPSSDAKEQPLPEAKTCFVTLTLPRYRSKDELERKLMLAIHHSPNMDADVLLHNAEGWADI